MNLPRKVKKGEPYGVMYDLWNNLIDYLSSSRLVAGSLISLQKYPSGTVISAARQVSQGGGERGASNQGYFTIEDASEMEEGQTVPTLRVKLVDTGANYSGDSFSVFYVKGHRFNVSHSQLVSPAIQESDSSNLCVFLHFHVTYESESSISGNVEVIFVKEFESVGNFPADTLTDFYCQIGRVTWSTDGQTYAKIDTIQQDHFGPVYFGGSGSGFPEYAGPWGLYLNYGSIKARSGLMWTPEGTVIKTATPCGIPEVSSVVIVDSDGVLSTLPAPNDDMPSPQSAHYWDSHTLLGRYDAELQKVTQYHFSPIVYMIQTEELVIPIIS